MNQKTKQDLDLEFEKFIIKAFKQKFGYKYNKEYLCVSPLRHETWVINQNLKFFREHLN